jgi:hypothetical protein
MMEGSRNGSSDAPKISSVVFQFFALFMSGICLF